MNSLLITSLVALAPFVGQAAQETPRPQGQTGQNAQNQQWMSKSAPQEINGSWNVVYVEMEGKKGKEKGFAEVMIKNNVLTCKHDGQVKSWRLDFMPNQQVRTTELNQGANPSANQNQNQNNQEETNRQVQANENNNAQQGSKGQMGRTAQGVYVASNEYLCLSLNHTQGSAKGENRQGRDETGSGRTIGQSAPQGNSTQGNATQQSGQQTKQQQTQQQRDQQQARDQQERNQQQGNQQQGNQSQASTGAGSQQMGPRGSEFVLILHRSRGESSARTE